MHILNGDYVAYIAEFDRLSRYPLAFRVLVGMRRIQPGRAFCHKNLNSEREKKNFLDAGFKQCIMAHTNVFNALGSRWLGQFGWL
jgi:hypothetical protein